MIINYSIIVYYFSLCILKNLEQFDGFKTIDKLTCPRGSQKISGLPVDFGGLRCRISAAVTKGFLVRVRIYLKRCSDRIALRFAPFPLTIAKNDRRRRNVRK